MKSKIEIINETVQYYSEDTARIGFDSEKGCVYLTSTGCMCAVGRCLIDPSKGYTGSVYNLRLHGISPITALDPELKPEYRGHEIDFWRDVQYLHDNSHHWDSTGLTEDGKDFSEHLLTKYAKQ